MRYWEEMNSKYGFNDGTSTPDGVEEYRKVYVKAMNTLLKRFNSDCRVVAFNRGGTKNSFLWLRVRQSEYETLTEEQVLSGDHKLDDEIAPDKAWEDAVEEANELGLDECVNVRVWVDEAELAAKLS